MRDNVYMDDGFCAWITEWCVHIYGHNGLFVCEDHACVCVQIMVYV